jgi:TRAP-type mannitol/chloroaromatic compound transport system permease large subunit
MKIGQLIILWSYRYCGYALFYLKGICPQDDKLTEIYRSIAPFIILQLVGLALVFAFPQLVIWLPSVAYG